MVDKAAIQMRTFAMLWVRYRVRPAINAVLLRERKMARELRIMMMTKRTTPVAKRACRWSPEAYPISMPMFVVNVLAESRKEVGIFTAFPRIMIMAMVSPMARPIPRMMLATIPDLAAGIRTRQMVCQCVAPRARAPVL